MALIESMILGLVQGLTEFLPVSSSGHLVIVQSLLPGFGQEDVLFDVLLHGATLAAVLVSFRKDIMELLRSLLPDGDPGARRVVGFIALATLPTGVIGYVFQDFFRALFHSPRAAAAMLLVTGTMVWLAETATRRERPMQELGVWRSLGVGVAQGLAIVPGISRSGATISAAWFMGVRAQDAARFSFLISIPAIVGAVGLELGAVESVAPSLAAGYGLGMLTAFVSGLWAIRFLMGVIRKGRMRWFALYCWAVGLLFLLWSA
jgi:undecaprenyl-diphosphatase